VLATAKWETAHTMEPVRETLASSDSQAIARLDNAWSKGQLRWVSQPYWRTGFFGRGYVQLTHEYNYRKAGNFLDIDLVKDPSLALKASIAVEILVLGMLERWFTGKELSDYITLERSDYVGARRIVNGTDKARAIAELAREYEDELERMGYGSERRAPVANERRDGTPPRSSRMQSTTNQTIFGTTVTTLASTSETAKQAVGTYSEAFGIPPQVIFAIIILAGLAYIFRERLRKWSEGDR